MKEEPRSAAARARAERALARLLAGLDGADIELVVLGGLVPEVLTRGRDVELPSHLGTTDVDILLLTHLEQNGDLSVVERSLKKLGFSPENDGWRWRGDVDGSKVKIEFLCDLDALKEEELAVPAGCEELKACNLRGTGYVARDWKWETLRSTSPSGERIEVRARFAGLQGYLLSKCLAARTRAAEKDYYDLAYVADLQPRGRSTSGCGTALRGKAAGSAPWPAADLPRDCRPVPQPHRLRSPVLCEPDAVGRPGAGRGNPAGRCGGGGGRVRRVPQRPHTLRVR